VTVPPYDLRVPTGADVPDVPFDMTNLATDVSDEVVRLDAQLVDMRYSLVRRGIWAGGVISDPTSTSISFGATFASPPDVVLSWYDGQYGACTSNDVTTTGATLLAVPIDGSTIVRVMWIAFGMKP
jgi:hypothetical protein